MVDLHVHSNKSDGSFSPKELVDYAIEKGLSAFALTDHDTTAGIDEAIDHAKQRARMTSETSASSHPMQTVEVIPGIEFSTEYEGKDIHIVGLYIDHHAPAFQTRIQAFVDSRILRNQKMCMNLQRAGIDISYEKLLFAFPKAVITRAHYARYLLNHEYVKSMPEAFDRYIGDHTPYFVPREKVTPKQAVELILAADGFPVLAHPTLYHMSDERLGKLVSELKAAGLMGMECLYSTYTPSETRKMTALAKRYDLLASGGSDFHGSNKPKLDLGCGYGKLCVPDEIMQNIKSALGKGYE
ncbi:MAG: PHP domain-containing protein [Clostridiales bacterium]|nr:PHP domain-containing protein [Clostridiales bacterium]